MESHRSLQRTAIATFALVMLAATALVDFGDRFGFGQVQVVAVFFGAMAAVVGAFHLLERRRLWRRGGEIARWAARRSFAFAREDDGSLADVLAGFALFDEVRGRRVRNVLRDLATDPQACYFDLRIVVVGDEYRTPHHRSVAAFHFREAAPAPFVLRPTNWAERSAPPWTDEGPVFPDDPEFTRRYRLGGPDPEAAAALFTPRVRAVLREQGPTWHAEGRGAWLVLWREEVAPASLDAFVVDARAVARALLIASASGPSPEPAPRRAAA